MSENIAQIVDGVVNGSLKDEDVIVWLHSIFEKGLDQKSTITLTKSMRDSGEVLDWPMEWKHLVVDKHSTGGVGDSVLTLRAVGSPSRSKPSTNMSTAV